MVTVNDIVSYELQASALTLESDVILARDALRDSDWNEKRIRLIEVKTYGEIVGNVYRKQRCALNNRSYDMV